MKAVLFWVLFFLAFPLEGFGQPLGHLVGRRVEVEHQGSRFAHLTSTLVYFHDLSDLTAAIEGKSLPQRHMAVLFRDSPRELVGYIVAVTREGTLVVGAQIHSWEPEKRRYVFSRAEIHRSYPPLNGARPWKWLVPISVGREYEATLEIEAVADRLPVRGLRVGLSNPPPAVR